MFSMTKAGICTRELKFHLSLWWFEWEFNITRAWPGSWTTWIYSLGILDFNLNNYSCFSDLVYICSNAWCLRGRLCFQWLEQLYYFFQNCSFNFWWEKVTKSKTCTFKYFRFSGTDFCKETQGFVMVEVKYTKSRNFVLLWYPWSFKFFNSWGWTRIDQPQGSYINHSSKNRD